MKNTSSALPKEKTGKNESNAVARILTLVVAIAVSTGASHPAEARQASMNMLPTRTQSKYPADVIPLSRSNAYFRQNEAPDYWALIPYYIGQSTNSACSLASVTTLLNGMRRLAPLTVDDPLLTPESVVDATGDKGWKRATDEDGGGVSIVELSAVLKKALRAHGFGQIGAETVMQSPNLRNGELEFERDLIRDEQSAKDFIILNFDQGVVMDEATVGHFALVGAYDRVNRRVLILDPDREWYEPYWAPIGKVYKAMWDSRGYIKVGF